MCSQCLQVCEDVPAVQRATHSQEKDPREEEDSEPGLQRELCV